jgi:hypothetical protein
MSGPADARGETCQSARSVGFPTVNDTDEFFSLVGPALRDLVARRCATWWPGAARPGARAGPTGVDLVIEVAHRISATLAPRLVEADVLASVL